MIKVTGIVLRGSGMTISFDDGTIAEADYILVNNILTLSGLTNAQKEALKKVKLDDSIRLDPRFTGIRSSSHIGDGNDKEKAHYATVTIDGTIFSSADTYTPILGVTNGEQNNFNLENNRATYIGSEINKPFSVQAAIIAYCGSEDTLGFKIAKNGVAIAQSEGTGTADFYTEAPAVASAFIQDVVELSPGDYVEIWAANKSSTASIGAFLNVIINEF